MHKAEEIKARIGLAGPPLSQIPEAPPAVPDHELVRCIGQGSYGEVWLARSAVGTWRAVKVVYRDHFKDPRPYEREFIGIQKYEPISRANEGLVDVLQIGRNDRERYFYYVMELADDASAERSAEVREERSAGVMECRGNGTTPVPQHSITPALQYSSSYVPKTLAGEIRARGRLSVEECITLGMTLNLALGHLHRNGLIHRDVKPSNIIFVNGVPKLADIGLVTELAEAQSFVGTEGFIPPEGPNSSQADLYALGKVLYEASMGKDRQEFPEPPTGGLGSDADSAALMELNEIVLRACAPSPKQRYQTAEEMNADLALLHSGQSVRNKHALERRLKITTRVTAAIVAAMVLGVLPYYWAIKEARAANIEAAKSQQVAQLLKDMLQSVGPSVALGRDTTLLKEVLDKAQARLSKDLSRQPDVEAELCSTLGDVYRELGQYKKSEELHRRALSLLQNLRGTENSTVASELDKLAAVLLECGKLPEAEETEREAVRLTRKFLGDDHPQTAHVLNGLAAVLRTRARLPEAESVQQQALTKWRMLVGEEHVETAEALNNLGGILSLQGKLADAEKVSREALAIKQRLLGAENPDVANMLDDLGGILVLRGRLDEAATNLFEALAMKKRLLGDEHPYIAVTLDSLVALYDWQGRPTEAESACRQALEMRRKFLETGVCQSRPRSPASPND